MEPGGPESGPSAARARPRPGRLAAAALLLVSLAPVHGLGADKPKDDKKVRAEQKYGDYLYKRPRLLTWLLNTPGDLLDYGRATVRRESVIPILAVIGSTALLVWKDQWLLDKAREAGDRLHISHSNDQRTFFSTKVPGANYNLYFQGPYDSGSALYYIGDGWVDFYLAGGFLVGGSLCKDNRQLQTGSQILESVLASGAVVQVLKHTTGRESPFVATQDGGRWVPFPNQIEYHKHVPRYDAYPSGHLAAGMATVTVIADNYPEYRFVRPLGYTLLGLLSFQMMNNGVHWASDYPLAVALGYGFGKIAVRKGRRRAAKETQATELTISPLFMGENATGAAFRWRFRG